MPIQVRHIDLHVLNMLTRMPFKYGIATLTALPHLFVRAQIEVDGQRQHGLASDGLPPKWFTKNPDTSFEQDLAEMMAVIACAAEAAADVPAQPSFFEWWQALCVMHRAKLDAADLNVPPLLAGLVFAGILAAIIVAVLGGGAGAYFGIIQPQQEAAQRQAEQAQRLAEQQAAERARIEEEKRLAEQKAEQAEREKEEAKAEAEQVRAEAKADKEKAAASSAAKRRPRRRPRRRARDRKPAGSSRNNDDPLLGL